MISEPKKTKLKLAGMTLLGAVGPLGAQWYSATFSQIADNIFSGITPTGVALSLLLTAILSMAISGLAAYLWLRTSLEHLPKEYKFEKKGAVLTRNGMDFCSKCFFQDRREIPLKENEKNSQDEIIFECVLKTEHQYRRWS